MDQRIVPAGCRAVAAALALLAIGPQDLGAQAEAQPAAVVGPDAIVLSTGASRGLAHAGALIALERKGYDPELVVGASMGAVIGALYAAGYSAEEIWDVALGTRWADLFISSPDVEGRDRELLYPSVTLGLEVGRLEVSSGVIPDWRVNRLLVHLLFDADARARSDFDRLPRRYRAVAADLSDGSEVVLAAGDLARAVRGSMGTPGFFAAINWGDRLLVDGGVANYLPVSVARALGAGRIVAVDVSRAPLEIRRTDPTAIGGRSISLLMRNALRDTIPPAVLVRPKLDPDFSGAFFPERPRLLLDLGLSAATAVQVAPSAPTPRRLVPAPPPVSLAALEVVVNDAALAGLARRALGDVVPGPYQPDRVLAAVDRLYASGLFSGVWPRVETRAGVGDVLVLTLDALPRRALKGSAGYDNDSGGRLWGAVDARVAALGVPTVARVGAGTDGVQRWFEASALVHSRGIPGVAWSVGVDHRRGTPPFFGARAVVPETRHTGAWAGLHYRKAFPDLFASAVARVERIDQRGGVQGEAWGPLLRVSMPRGQARVVGIPAELEVGAWRGAHRDEELGARGSVIRELGALKMAVLADARLALGDPPLDALPSLGDDRLMPGLRRGQERGRARVVAGVDVARPLLGGGWWRLRLRGGAAGEPRDLDDPERWMGGAALDGVWNTPLGPLVVGFGMNTTGRHRVEVGIAAF